MIDLPGYDTSALLHESSKTTIWRARRIADGARVILKRTRSGYAKGTERARIRHEHDILGLLTGVEGAVQAHALVKTSDGPALVLEDIGGIPLKDAAAGFSLDRFLSVGARVARALEEVHRRGVIHKDINPANLVYNPSEDRVQIIDFGIASQLSVERQRPGAPDLLEGTLRYISPEQTGRMNRAIDWRTDLYSLGMTLYELICGRPPFGTMDPLELIHSAIARKALAPQTLDPTVPRAVSDIVMRLLEKAAEDRYQSAYGLASDLETCARRLSAHGQVGYFPLARRDLSAQFHLPQRLYGRKRALTDLTSAYEQIGRGGVELRLFEGPAGIGKSALVRELQKHVNQQRGYFAAGKFEPLQRGVPYASFIQAFRDLLRQLLTEDDARIADWRLRLGRALGPNGQLLVDVIPELALIVGPQPAPRQLPPAESRNRFDALIEDFIHAFPSEAHPLVLFLDDLQWADDATVALLQRLSGSASVSHLLLVGAAREVMSGGALEGALLDLQRAGCPASRVALGAMTGADVRLLVADTLHQEPDEVMELAALVHDRTGGNPYFVREYLSALHGAGAIGFDMDVRRWTWRAHLAASAAATESVAELLGARLRALPTDSGELLSAAACVGDRFDLAALASVVSRPPSVIASELWPALRSGLIQPERQDYKFALASPESLDDDDELAGDQRFAFTHDRIQQAAYDCLSEAARQRIHLAIGRGLRERLTPDSRGGVLEACVHMNLGRALITDPTERTALAALNLEAGERALAANATDVAAETLATGTALLPPTAPRAPASLWWRLSAAAMRAALLRGDWETRGALAEAMLAESDALEDQAAVLELEVQELQARHLAGEAFRASAKLLALLGFPLPTEPGAPLVAMARVGAALTRVRIAIGRLSPAQIDALPPSDDPRLIIAMRLLNGCASSAYYVSPFLIPVVMLKMTELSIRRGMTAHSAYGFVGYAFILTAFQNNVERGRAYAALALSLVRRFDARELEPRIQVLHHGFIHHRHAHYRESLPAFRSAWQRALEVGDQEYAALAGAAYVNCVFQAGLELSTNAEECQRYEQAIERLNQQRSYHDVQLQRQLVDNLMDSLRPPEALSRISGRYLDRDRFLAVAAEAGDATAPAKLHVYETLLAYLFGGVTEAAENASLAEEGMKSLPGAPQLPLGWLYCALAWLRAARTPDAGLDAARLTRSAERAIAKLERWSTTGAANCAHKLALARAELARNAGAHLAAMALYEEAIAAASAEGFSHEQALALELAGRHHLEGGRSRAARAYLLDACYAWEHWGANARAASLRAEMSDHLGPILAALERDDQPGGTMDATRTGEGGLGQPIDYALALQAAQAIAGELVLDRLIDRIMALLIAISGAERGVLLLTDNDGLILTASARLDSAVEPMAASLEQSGGVLPLSIINYVRRTGQPLSLDDPAADPSFSWDQYLIDNRPRSVLSRPLSSRGELMGVLYLEHSGAPGVFSPARNQTLQLLCAQAAVSIANARLYADLQTSLSKQTQLTRAYGRFVPHEFLEFLEKDSIVEVGLGDQIQQDMTILFADVRSFTSLSEAMSPKENFDFLNDLLRRIGPMVREHGGFVDKYIGDAVMALFPDGADDALDAAAAIQRAVSLFNSEREQRGLPPVGVGVGVHYGTLMLGTIGESMRMETTVISDAVNIASRLQGLTREFEVEVVLSAAARDALTSPGRHRLAPLGSARVKGRCEEIEVLRLLI